MRRLMPWAAALLVLAAAQVELGLLRRARATADPDCIWPAASSKTWIAPGPRC